jgi:hypothetical protein
MRELYSTLDNQAKSKKVEGELLTSLAGKR